MAEHDHTPTHLGLIAELAALERPTWAARSRDLRLSGVPVNEGDDPENEPKTVPQSEVDRIVKDRLARQAAKFADYDELKAKAEKADELEAAGQSETERLQAQIKKLERERDTAIGERDTARTDLQAVRVESEIRKALPKDVVDADAVLQLLPRDQVTVGDDGQVTGHEDAVKALLEAKPYLVGPPTPARPTGPRDGGARGIPAVNPDNVPAGTARLAAAYGQSNPT